MSSPVVVRVGFYFEVQERLIFVILGIKINIVLGRVSTGWNTWNGNMCVRQFIHIYAKQFKTISSFMVQ